MKIGDLVNNENKNRLYCGSGMYPHAVIVSLKPFILVSEGTDMRWDKVNKSEVAVVLGKAGFFTMLMCLRRLSMKEKFLFLKQILGIKV